VNNTKYAFHRKIYPTPTNFYHTSISSTVREHYNLECSGGNLPPPPLPVYGGKIPLPARGYPSKTEAMLCGTSAGVEVAGTAVKFGDFIKLLGVKLDPSVSMNRHVTELVRSCNYHIRALRHIRPLLTLESTTRTHQEIR